MPAEVSTAPRAGAAGPIAAFVGLGLFWGALGVLLPDIKAATGVTDGQLGLALLASSAGALPAMLLVGPWADRHGERAVAAGLVIFGLLAVLPGVATGLPLLAGGLLACGAASGALDVTMNAAVARIEATGRRLMGLAHAMFSVGLLVASIGVGLARQAGADRRAILAVVALVLVATAALNLGPTGHGGTVPRASRRGNVTRPLLVLGVLCALAFTLEGGLQSWSAIHLEETLGAEPAVAGVGLGLFAGAMVAGRLFAQGAGARLSDDLLLVLAGLVAAGGAAATALAPGVPLALAGLALAGFGISIAAPVVFSLAGRSRPQARGPAIATVNTVAYVGFLGGPPLVGLVADAANLRVGRGARARAGARRAAATLALRPRESG